MVLRAFTKDQRYNAPYPIAGTDSERRAGKEHIGAARWRTA
jgi:hypothetical protein